MENLTELESYSTSRFIDPTLVRLPTFECSVRSDGVSIRRGDQLLNYTLKSPHKPGTELMAVNSHSGITFYLKSEYESYREAKRKESQAQQAASQQAARERTERMAAEAKAFNDSLNIPYNWSLVSKIVLSGLSQHGHGDGTNKRTVHHIQLLEPVEYGRLKREPGDLLCRANHGSYDLSGAPDTGKVTCRQCLKLAERWKECLTEPKQHPYINSDTSEHYSLRDLLD